MTSVNSCLNLLESSQLAHEIRPEMVSRSINHLVKFRFGQCHSATKDVLTPSDKSTSTSIYCTSIIFYLQYSATLFQPPKARGIGTNHALLFEAWAHFLELFGPQKRHSFSQVVFCWFCPLVRAKEAWLRRCSRCVATLNVSGKMLKQHETTWSDAEMSAEARYRRGLTSLAQPQVTWEHAWATHGHHGNTLAAQARLRARRADFDVTALHNCTHCCWRIIAFQEVQLLGSS